jgi:hypothetical protein
LNGDLLTYEPEHCKTLTGAHNKMISHFHPLKNPRHCIGAGESFTEIDKWLLEL